MKDLGILRSIKGRTISFKNLFWSSSFQGIQLNWAATRQIQYQNFSICQSLSFVKGLMTNFLLLFFQKRLKNEAINKVKGLPTTVFAYYADRATLKGKGVFFSSHKKEKPLKFLLKNVTYQCVVVTLSCPV